MINFDYILEKVGALGKYQILICLGLFYIGIPTGLNDFVIVFMAYSPSYRCEMYPFDDSNLYPNLTSQEILHLTTPLDQNGDPVDPCVKYGYNTTTCSMIGDLSCVNKSESIEQVECAEYIYDESLFTETIVTQFDLVCDRRFLNSVASSAYLLGSFGGALFGLLSDRFGRKLSNIISAYGMLLTMLAVTYSNSLTLFTILRFVSATFTTGSYIAIFTYVMEIVGNKRRTLVGVTIQISYAIGYMLWSGVAYLYRDWQQMQLAAFVLSLPLALIVLVVPESPRWLFTVGNEKQGKKIAYRMAKMNGVELDENIWNEAENSSMQLQNEKNSDKKFTPFDLFRHRGSRVYTLKVAFIWAMNGMIYYGISYNIGNLAGNLFLNNIYAGIFEITTYIICILTMDRVGRRLLLNVALLASGVSLLIGTVIGELTENESAVVVLSLFGKAFISASYAVIYNYTGELFPTVARGYVVGLGSLCAVIGSAVTPFLIELQNFVSWLPYTIFGVGSIIGGLMSLTFRDTTGREMMETMEEAELFYAGKDPSSKNEVKEHACENKAMKVIEDSNISSTYL